MRLLLTMDDTVMNTTFARVPPIRGGCVRLILFCTVALLSRGPQLAQAQQACPNISTDTPDPCAGKNLLDRCDPNDPRKVCLRFTNPRTNPNGLCVCIEDPGVEEPEPAIVDAVIE